SPDAFARWSVGGVGVDRVFANEQLRYLAGVEVGDTFELETELGLRPFEVLGFFHDYGNVNFSLYLPSERFEQLYPSAEPQGWGIWVQQNKHAIAEFGLSQLGVEPTQWVSQRDVLALSLAIFDRTFAITRALNALTLLVAAIAIFSSLLAVYQFRRSEYALWRSLGMSWSGFFTVLGFPIVLMTAVVMALALPLGIVLSWLLIHKINVISFGWTMPLIVAAEPIVFLFVVVTMVVLAAFAAASMRQHAAVNKALKSLAGE
ncbi:MAG: ABC transporter permease, partial [Pseudomonadota bacterium]|nr:ABC transporter permease [Pseudomonadota bacterium]